MAHLYKVGTYEQSIALVEEMLRSESCLVACLLTQTHFNNDLVLSRATAFHYIWRQVIFRLCSKHVMRKFGITLTMVVHKFLISKDR